MLGIPSGTGAPSSAPVFALLSCALPAFFRWRKLTASETRPASLGFMCALMEAYILFIVISESFCQGAFQAFL